MNLSMLIYDVGYSTGHRESVNILCSPIKVDNWWRTFPAWSHVLTWSKFCGHVRNRGMPQSAICPTRIAPSGQPLQRDRWNTCHLREKMRKMEKNAPLEIGCTRASCHCGGLPKQSSMTPTLTYGHWLQKKQPRTFWGFKTLSALKSSEFLKSSVTPSLYFNLL